MAAVFHCDRRRFLRTSASAAAGLLAAPVSALAGVPQQRTRPAPSSSPSLSRQFARWVAGLRYDDLPAGVVDRVKGLTLQNISSALLGSRTASGQQAAQFILDEESGVARGATLIASGQRVTTGGAAFANSEMMYAGGKWDTFRMLTHPGTVIIPAALAAAETEGASGRDFITGVAAGYEVMERMGGDWIPTVMARGFHAGPVFSLFGAAVAAAKIMGFTADQLHAVISLCTNLAGSNLESRALREGAAARNAMLAVGLARHGTIGGGDAVLEGPAGFYRAYAGNNTGELTYSFTGDTHTSLQKLTDHLGADWMLLETLYRIYSIPGYNIAHIDVTAKLCEEHDIRYEDVDYVEAVVNWLETQYPSPAFPTQREDTTDAPRRGSTRYYSAYAVVTRGYPMLPGTPDPPAVLELMKRVRIIPSHRMTLFGPRITIVLKDGRSFTKQATGREFIWDFEEEARRIRAIVPGLSMAPAQFEQLIGACRALEGEQRADALVHLTLNTRS
ncbi:MAG TPA: MmgE/PrpD family protein [Vicinamibacterales bacterium]|nr:MmgE/PrpD family protein [Vicinamibacterales bacterium]